MIPWVNLEGNENGVNFMKLSWLHWEQELKKQQDWLSQELRFVTKP